MTFWASWVIAAKSSGYVDPLTISLFFFKESNDILASTIIYLFIFFFFEDTSCSTAKGDPRWSRFTSQWGGSGSCLGHFF